LLKNKLIYIRVLVASFVGLLLLSYLLLLLPIVQEKIGQRIATNFSQTLGTEFKLEGLSFSLLNRVDIKNVLIRDQQKDTLLFAQTLKLRLSDLIFSSKAPTLGYWFRKSKDLFTQKKSSLELPIYSGSF